MRALEALEEEEAQEAQFRDAAEQQRKKDEEEQEARFRKSLEQQKKEEEAYQAKRAKIQRNREEALAKREKTWAHSLLEALRDETELNDNPRARSAKLRVVERV